MKREGPVVRCARCGSPLLGGNPNAFCARCASRYALEETSPQLASSPPPELPLAIDQEQPLEQAHFAPGGLSRFGDYELIREIAHGGMGVVYLARQVSLNRQVAVKMLLFGQFAEPKAFQRFRAEAEIAARLQHPNIVAIHEIGEQEGQPYFSMDYVEGRDLGELVRDRPMPARAAAGYLAKIGRAIQYAHAQGVLHRDLKPANILIDQSDEPRITDFGLAKQLTADSGLTLSGQVLGSPNFMPPEQGRGGGGRVGPPVDVYGLGAILYYLVTGRPPFMAETFEATLQAVLEVEPMSPRQLNPSVPRDLETICLKCLEKDPGRRYGTARELAEELERFLRGEPIRARLLGPVGKGWRWCKRRPAVAGAVAVVLVVAAVALLRIQMARRAEQREAYYARIALANTHVQEGNLDQALELLWACPERFRGWEWGHLLYLCHPEVALLPARRDRSEYLVEGVGAVTVRFLSDGRRLGVLDLDEVLTVWDWAEEKELFVVGESTNGVVAWAVNPEGTLMAAGFGNGSLRAWDTATWEVLFSLNDGPSPVTVMALAEGQSSPHGQSGGPNMSVAVRPLLAVGTGQRTVQLRDARTGQLRFDWTNQVENVSELAFAKGGRRLIGRSRAMVSEWDTVTGERVQYLAVDTNNYQVIFTDPEARRFATLDEGSRVRLWESENQEGGPRAARRSDPISLVLGGDGCPPVGWRCLDLGLIRGVQSEKVRRIFFSPDGRWVCLGGDEGTARLYRTDTGELHFTVSGHVHDAVFSADSRLVAVAGAQNVVRVWDAQGGRELLKLRGHTNIIECLALSADGRLAAAADIDRTIRVWSALPGRDLVADESFLWGTRMSRDGNRIAVTSYWRGVHVWDAVTGQRLLHIDADYDLHMFIDISPDGQRLLTCGTRDYAQIWEAQTGRLLHYLHGHTRQIPWGVFSPEGRRIATASWDGTVHLWDADSGRCLDTLGEFGTNKLNSVAFTPNGRELIVGVRDSTVRVVDLASRRQRLCLRMQGTSSGLEEVTVSADGGYVAGGIQGWVYLWRVASGELIRRWSVRGSPSSIRFSPDGKRLATVTARYLVVGMDVGTVEIWDVDTGQQVLVLRRPKPFFFCDLSPDGRTIVTGGDDCTVQQWESFPWRQADYHSLPNQPFAVAVRAFARGYWRERLAKEQSVDWFNNKARVSVYVPFDRGLLPSRDARATACQIDLTPHYNRLLTDRFDETSGMLESVDNDLCALQQGTVNLGGVTFDVRGLILLRRREPRGPMWALESTKRPDRVDGIRVGQKFHRLHLLHALTPEPERDGVAARLVWHYADGTQQVHDVRVGVHALHWWKNDQAGGSEAELPQGRVVWTGRNPFADMRGATLRLYLSTWENPRPDVEVTHIDYVSGMETVASFMVAMTVE